MNQLLDNMQSLSTERRALVEGRIAGRIAATNVNREPDGIGPRDTSRRPPLSFSQERLWLIDQLLPGNVAYNVPLAVHLNGTLDVPALRAALTEVRRRHEVLRTTFPDDNGVLAQVVGPAEALPLPVEDLSRLPGASRDAVAAERALEEARRPFDLARGPLLRTTLLRLGADRHILLIVAHHMITDAWSTAVLLDELARVHASYVAGMESPLPEPVLQYADYAVWQHEHAAQGALEAQSKYWRSQLDGSPPVLELPADRPRPVAPSFRGARHTFRLSPSLTEGLHNLARDERATLFMVLLAGFAAVLQRYTGQDDILVGSPIAGRARFETERLIGLFVNTLVLRTDLSGNPTFRELVQRVREVALGAYANQDLPFEQLVGPDSVRSLTINPLFQVMFQLENTPPARTDLAGLSMSVEEIHNGTARFDLRLSLRETPDGLDGEFEYNTDLFETPTIEHLADNLRVLLEGTVADPDGLLADLPLLTSLERHLLLVEWNATYRNFPTGTLHELVAQQAEHTPDATAVVFANQVLSYADLDRRANQVANHLRSLGVGPEVFVGLCAERSPELLVGLLGILKAGGAYIPLDPTYPADRLAFMMADTQSPVLLTQAHLVTKVAAPGTRVVCLDSDWHVIRQMPETAPATDVQPANLAYVIYTSGSTGGPKGVAIEHRSAVAFVHWARSVFSADSLASVLASTSICFDLSIFELFVPLSGGHRVVLVQNALNLATLPPDASVTLVNTVPSAMHELERLGLLPPSLEVVNLAGEQLPSSLARRLYQTRRIRRVFNLYGPTETTTYSTFTLVENGGQTPPPIGRPIANTRVYVLDERRRLVPIGVRGSSTLGARDFARGYVNRPEQTAEKFVPDPFNSDPTARLYRTGDLVRYGPDGNLEFLGRMDNQVKIRGFRIEPAEVETALRGHPRVRDAAVLAREDVPGDKHLTAYVVAEGELDTTELRAHVLPQLPAYMIPTRWVFVDALPLTPNGKLDRKRLAAPDATPAASSESCGPRDALDDRLLRLWEEVLGVQSVSITDNFFELGGHSLLAVRLFAQIEAFTGQKLPLATLFQAPTIEQLADVLNERAATAPFSMLVPIQVGSSRRRPFFCVHGFGGGVIDYAKLARHLDPGQPFYAIQARELAGNHAPSRSVDEMAMHYLKELRSFQPQGPYLLGGYSQGGEIVFEMAQQLIRDGQQVALLALFDTHPRLSLLTQLGLAPRDLPHFVRNLPGWFRDFSGQQPSVMRSRLRRKFKSMVALTLARVPGCRNLMPLTLEDVLDDADTVPEERREFMEVHLSAMYDYRGQSYPGRITVFRAAIQPFLSWHDPALRWDHIAQGGVNVEVVPGSHHDLLKEPYVTTLGRRLKPYLDRLAEPAPDGAHAGQPSEVQRP